MANLKAFFLFLYTWLKTKKRTQRVGQYETGLSLIEDYKGAS